MTSVHLCVDCEFVRVPTVWDTRFWGIVFNRRAPAPAYSKCARVPIVGYANRLDSEALVTGVRQPHITADEMQYCLVARDHECGPDGLFWEPRE